MLTGILIGAVIATVFHSGVRVTVAKIGGDQARVEAATWKAKHDALAANINDGK